MTAIVLTGTIIPNAIKVAHRDSIKRRLEYLEAIRFFREFSRVYFLENSLYDLSHDVEFQNDERVRWLKYEPSKEYEKGKGYQEFQMLDKFVKDTLCEDDFIKITGRYIYENFNELFLFILKAKVKYDLIIDSFAQRKMALTSLFYIRKDVYLNTFLNSYLEMDDSSGLWAEHVFYSKLKNVAHYTFFSRTPVFHTTDSSTGLKMATRTGPLKVTLKNVQRAMLMTIGVNKLLL
jgi:hypothetical protein